LRVLGRMCPADALTLGNAQARQASLTAVCQILLTLRHSINAIIKILHYLS